MTQFNVYHAKAQLSKLIELSLSGEEIIIARGNKPLVKLVPLGRSGGKRILGTAKGKVKIAKDFTEPLKDFQEYM